MKERKYNGHTRTYRGSVFKQMHEGAGTIKDHNKKLKSCMFKDCDINKKDIAQHSILLLI